MVTLPLTLSASNQTTPFSAFRTAIHSVVTGEPRDFIFGTLTYHSASHAAEEKSSLKGAWSGTDLDGGPDPPTGRATLGGHVPETPQTMGVSSLRACRT